MLQATAFAGAAAGLIVTIAAIRLRVPAAGAHAALLAPALIVVAVLLVVEDATGRGAGSRLVGDLMASIRGAVEVGDIRLEDLVIFAAAFWTIGAFFVHATVAGSPRVAIVAPLVAALAVTVIDPAEASWVRIAADVAMVGAVLVAAALDERTVAKGRFRPAPGRPDGSRGWIPYPVMASAFALVALVGALAAAPVVSLLETGSAGFPVPGGGSTPASGGLNHFVDIHDNLTTQSDVPLFEVTYDQARDVAGRVRLLTLPRFEEDAFHLGDPGDDTLGDREVGHRVRILRPFDSSWMPAVPGATLATAPAVVVPGGVAGEQTPGLSYRVTSRPVGSGGPGEAPITPPPTETLALTGLDDADAVRTIAEQLAGGAPTDLEALVNIEHGLRSRIYRLPQQRRQVDLVAWLGDDDASGYCEQFAVGMAVLVRSLGIPSRVVVGFLPGATEGSVVTVTGAEAHAWVEAWIDGVGWLPFDPTPGERSGAALGDPYLRLAVVDGLVPAPTEGAEPDPVAPPAPAGIADGGLPIGVVVALGIALAVPVVLAVATWTGRRSRRRRAEAGDVVAAWDAIVVRLGEAGMAPQASATPLEIAQTTTATMEPLASGFTKQAYGTAVLTANETDRALQSMRRTDAELLAAMSASRRVLAATGIGVLRERAGRKLSRWRRPRR